MRVLLDECIPRKLKNALVGVNCLTAPEAGFANLRNGILLSLAEGAGFDVFVTMDKGIEYEQTLQGRKIAIIVLRAKSNRLNDLVPHVPACLAVIGSIRPGQALRIAR